MKKFFTTLFVIALSSSVFATAYNWSVNTGGPGASAFKGMSYFAVNTSLSEDLLAKLAGEDGYNVFKEALESASVSYNDGNLHVGTGAGSGTITGVDASQDASLSFIVFEGITDGSTFYYIASMTVSSSDASDYFFDETASPAETSTTYGINFLKDSVSTGTLGSAVPEPTVLALLALGVAGVALRRKKVVA